MQITLRHTLHRLVSFLLYVSRRHRTHLLQDLNHCEFLIGSWWQVIGTLATTELIFVGLCTVLLLYRF